MVEKAVGFEVLAEEDEGEEDGAEDVDSTEKILRPMISVVWPWHGRQQSLNFKRRVWRD